LNQAIFPIPGNGDSTLLVGKLIRPKGPVMIGAGGARGPGKSHAIFSQVTLDDCQRMPNLKALFLRQTGKAAKESLKTSLVVLSLKEYPMNMVTLFYAFLMVLRLF